MSTEDIKPPGPVVMAVAPEIIDPRRYAAEFVTRYEQLKAVPKICKLLDDLTTIIPAVDLLEWLAEPNILFRRRRPIDMLADNDYGVLYGIVYALTPMQLAKQGSFNGSMNEDR